MTVVNELIIEEEDQDDREEARIASYLVAECGTTNSAVTLFDVAGGSFQIIARGVSQTTAGSPWRDVNQGILYAIDQIEENSERALLSRGKTVSRSPAHGGAGVDYFGTVVSAAPPIKTLLVGLLDDGTRVIAETKTIYNRNLRWSDLRGHQPERLDLNKEYNGVSLLVWVSSHGVFVMDWVFPNGIFKPRKGLTPTLAESLDVMDVSTLSKKGA